MYLRKAIDDSYRFVMLFLMVVEVVLLGILVYKECLH